ncbi:MAG: iron ABC transporter [Bacteroidetes bacterium]|nr:MAG: iron ABC transporter [Bacteroidota bacterium]
MATRMNVRSTIFTTVVLTLFTILISVIHLIWGPVDLSKVPDEVREVIFWEVRLPRVLTALGAGAGLALTGQFMQTWFRNSLAGPSVLGITSGGSLGVAIVTLLGVASFGVMPAAAIGSLGVLILIFSASKRFTSPVTLLVFGLMVGYTVGAIVTVLQAEARAEELQAFVFWGMGSFGNSTLKIALILPFLAIIAMIWGMVRSKWLDAWTLGENTAITMGTPSKKFRMEIIVIVGIVAGSITSVCGPIAFLGLATPHVVKMITSERSHNNILPLVVITGALIALLADLLVRSPWSDSSGLPLNAILALFGAPVVIAVIWKRTHEL